jgi:phosphoribosylformimino-5-aminoimidazole carboxamide ribotide isomerase
MEIVPVIELKAGKSARALQAKEELRYFRTDDPLKIAKHFRDAGAKRLRLHDLDGQRVGTPQNRDTVRDLARRIGIPIDFSGGVKSADIVERVFTWGVDRVSADPHTILDSGVKPVLERHGARVGLEIRDVQGTVTRPGHVIGTPIDVHAFVRSMGSELGWQRFEYIPSHPNGALASVSLPQIERFLQSAGRPVDLVAPIGDLDEIAEIAGSGIDTLALLEALYDGSMALAEAMQAARGIPKAPPSPQPGPGVKRPASGFLPTFKS